MLSFKCPQCNAENKMLMVNWRNRSGRRCGSCGVRLEMENGALIGALVGLLGGGLAVGLKEVGVRSFPVQLVVTVVVMSLAAFVLTAFTARWKVKPEVVIDSPELRKWRRVLNISIYVGLVVIISTQVFLAVELKRLQVMSASADSTAAVESIDRIRDSLMLLTPIGLGLFLITLAVAVFASLKCKRTRRLLTSDTPDAGPEGPA